MKSLGDFNVELMRVEDEQWLKSLLESGWNELVSVR